MRSSLSAAIFAACVAPSALANLVANGDFEEPVIATPYRVVPGGDAFITDWTVTAPVAGNGVDLVNEVFAGAGYANTNDQSIDLAGTPGRGTIYQDLVTVPGQTYKLSFWLSTNGPQSSDSVTIQWDNIGITTLTSPNFGTWEEHVLEVEASGALTRLAFVGNIDGNSNGALLDTVSVDEVPAPGALALAGIAGVMGIRRRR